MSWYVGLFTSPTKPGKPKADERKAKIAEAHDPARDALLRDQRARSAAAEALAKGRGSTILTGQYGATGQIESSRPTLLGG